MIILYRINFFILFFILFVFSIYSQNKILSDNSKNWKKIETDSIILYYPENYGYLALRTISEASKAISYYSIIFNHKLTHQIIIIIYPSFRDFQSSSIHPFLLPEGIGGYTEPYYERVVIPYTSDEDFFHTLKHELVHSFQYDILLNVYKERNINIPLWLIEGMAEYLSIGMDSSMEIFLRDIIISKNVPDVIEIMNLSGYANYKIGQSIMYFIHKNWSMHHISILFRNIIENKDLNKSFIITLGMNFFDFILQWQNFIYELYKTETFNSEEYKYRITFRYNDLLNNQVPFHYKPSISQDGKYISYITYDKIYPVIIIEKYPEPYDLKNSDKKNIIAYLKDEELEEWQPLTTKINFDKSNQYLFIPTRNRSQLAILKLNILTKKIEYIYYLPFDSVEEPEIDKESKNLIFIATLNGISNIYILNIENNKISKITNTSGLIFSPVFSLEKDKILYVKKINDQFLIIKTSLQKNNYNNYKSLKEEVVVKKQSEIKNIKEGYFFINNIWVEGLYYNIKIKNKFQLVFYNCKDNKEYLITNNNRDIFSFDLTKDKNSLRFLYSTLEEGTYEIFGYDLSNKNKEFINFYKNILEFNFNSMFEASEQKDILKTCCNELNTNKIHIRDLFSSYKSDLYRNGYPFIALSGAFDSEGNSSIVFLGFGSFADLQKKHQIDAFITYQEKPVILNGEILYTYNLNRIHYNAGLYSYNGVFVILNPLDISLNNIIYNPFQRLLSNSVYGMYASTIYNLHQYSSIGLQLNIGRNEQIYLPRLPEERPNEDIFQNHLTLRFYYTYDNSKYTLYGPLDGYSILFGYEVPLKSNIFDKEVYQTIMEFRYYYLFRDFSLFAYRLFLGAQTGKDSKNYPYRLGGYSTIRGYEFQKFEGKYAFLMNLEYRFTFIEQLIFGFPFRWNPGLVRGSIFLDLGSAFDEPKRFQAIEGKKTKDLRASIGIGMHFNNFLWFIFPGAIMKIEWASPYDGKKSLPFSKWQGRFSLGFNF